MTTTEQPKGRTLTGIVTSDKRTKTVTVQVSRLKMHPKYRKQYKVSAKYHAHDENGEYHTGDRVVIRETRPLSKTKRWIVVEKLAVPNK
jgi:small subunit ribosomal protein S17